MAGTSYVEILHNDGNFAFSDVTAATIGDYRMSDSIGAPAGYYRLRDVDGDGDLDLVVGFYNVSPASLAAGRNAVFLNDGHGKLDPLRLRRGGAPVAAAAISAAFGKEDWEASGLPLILDANGDGVNDIVLVNGSHFGAPLPASPERYLVWTVLAGP